MEQLITHHLHIWTTAQEEATNVRGKKTNGQSPYGIKKLRELILELAVRGKLVEQDPQDEPASVLLERITEEKARLIKEGKIKKQKKLPEISEEEKPFELPEGWEWTRVGSVFDFQYGKALPAKKRDENGNVDVYGSNGVVGKHSDALITTPCIVIGRKGSAGALNITKGPSWTTDVAYFLDPHPSFVLQYVYLLLKSFKLEELGKGIKPGVNRNEAYLLVGAIPPPTEQQRIVAKVHELMTLCDQLEEKQDANQNTHQALVETLLTTLTSSTTSEECTAAWNRLTPHFNTLFTTDHAITHLKQTILQLAVMGKLVEQNPHDEPASVLLEKIDEEKTRLIKAGKIKKQKKLPEISEEDQPFSLPAGWEWVHLGSIVKVMDAGWSPACPTEPSPSKDVWGVLKTTAVQVMEYRQYENKVLPASKEPRPQYEVQKGDILITRAGPKNRVAISCLVDQTRPKLMISDKIIRFHVYDVGVQNRYIALCLNTGATADYLEQAKSGMAESQMNISQTKLRLAPIPLCPPEEQQRIITKIDELLYLCDQLQVKLTDQRATTRYLSDTLFQQAIYMEKTV